MYRRRLCTALWSLNARVEEEGVLMCTCGMKGLVTRQRRSKPTAKIRSCSVEILGQEFTSQFGSSLQQKPQKSGYFRFSLFISNGQLLYGTFHAWESPNALIDWSFQHSALKNCRWRLEERIYRSASPLSALPVSISTLDCVFDTKIVPSFQKTCCLSAIFVLSCVLYTQ